MPRPEILLFDANETLFDLAPFHLIGRPDGDSVSLEALGPDLAPAFSARVELY